MGKLFSFPMGVIGDNEQYCISMNFIMVNEERNPNAGINQIEEWNFEFPIKLRATAVSAMRESQSSVHCEELIEIKFPSVEQTGSMNRIDLQEELTEPSQRIEIANNPMRRNDEKKKNRERKFEPRKSTGIKWKPIVKLFVGEIISDWDWDSFSDSVP